VVLTAHGSAPAITINPTYDATVTSNVNSAAIQNAFNYACLQFKNMFSDPINININVVAGTSGLGQSSTAIVGTTTYTAMRSLMLADASSADDATATASLPVLSPLPGGSLIVYSRAQGKALSLITNDLVNDGTYTFNATQPFTFDPANRQVPGTFDFIAVSEHEISEIMGRIAIEGFNFFGQADYIPGDLFRFTGAGVRKTTATGSGVYLSIDSGATNLKTYNQSGNGGDIGDWASGTNDCYNAFSGTGVMNDMPPVDFTQMDVIGYNRTDLFWTGFTNQVTWDIFNRNNWSNGSSTKYTDAANVVFDDTATVGSFAVTLDQTVRPNSVVFNNSANAYTFSGTGAITGGGSVTKNGSNTVTIAHALTYAGATVVNAGKLSLSTNLLTSSSISVTGGTLELTPLKTRVLRSLVISVTGSGKIDLQDNKLITSVPVGAIIGTTSTYSGMTALIQSGYNPATPARWDGSTGIVTSQTFATTGHLTSIGIATAAQAKRIAATATTVWAGQIVSGGDTLVMYTYGGDANLDGKINIDDYGHIDTSVRIGLTGWFNGDFNYDGKIDIDDYGIIDTNVGMQNLGVFPTVAGFEIGEGGAGVASGGIASLAGIGSVSRIAGEGAAGTVAIPEPAGVSLMTVAPLLLLGRRRRCGTCRV
jgi:autotransporter-associated beta strand protein